MQELFHEILTKENLSPYNTLTELVNGAGMYIYSVVPKGLDLSENLANNFIAYLLSYKYPTEDNMPINITTVDEYLLWRWVNKYYKTSNIQNITQSAIQSLYTQTVSTEHIKALLQFNESYAILNERIYPSIEVCNFVLNECDKNEFCNVPLSYFKDTSLKDIQKHHKQYVDTGKAITLEDLLEIERTSLLELKNITDIYITETFYVMYNKDIVYTSAEKYVLPAMGVEVSLQASTEASTIHLQRVNDTLYVHRMSGAVEIKLLEPLYINHCGTVGLNAVTSYVDSEVYVIDTYTLKSSNIIFTNCKVHCTDPSTFTGNLIESEAIQTTISPKTMYSLVPDVIKSTLGSNPNEAINKAITAVPQDLAHLYI